jgi:hypothetical protein
MAEFKFGITRHRKSNHHSVDGVSVHEIQVRVVDFPIGLPRDANPRQQNTNKEIYREVTDSLLRRGESANEAPGSFDLKHRGISIVATDVVVKDGVATVSFADSAPDGLKLGIVDGGHTAEIFREVLSADPSQVPENQRVNLRIFTGLEHPASLSTSIATGLNAGIQLAARSAADHRGDFEFLKEALSQTSDHRPGTWADRISWPENDPGDYSVVDVLAMMACFDTWTHPIGGGSQPVDAHRRKSTMLERLVTDPSRFRRLVKILPDILQLFEIISHDAYEKWGTEKSNNFLQLGYVKKTFPEGSFHFDDDGSPAKLYLPRGAVYPMFAAFRCMVVDDEPYVSWNFSDVLTLWDIVGQDLLYAFYDHYKASGSDLTTAARSVAIWQAFADRVELAKFKHLNKG